MKTKKQTVQIPGPPSSGKPLRIIRALPPGFTFGRFPTPIRDDTALVIAIKPGSSSPIARKKK